MALQQVMEKYSHSTDLDVNLPEKTLFSRFVTLYNEATNWYTRQQILSVFVGNYFKTELLSFIPGLTKWGIDEARKHSFSIKIARMLPYLLRFLFPNSNVKFSDVVLVMFFAVLPYR